MLCDRPEYSVCWSPQLLGWRCGVVWCDECHGRRSAAARLSDVLIRRVDTLDRGQQALMNGTATSDEMRTSARRHQHHHRRPTAAGLRHSISLALRLSVSQCVECILF